MAQKKVLIFDLDGTLAESKQALDSEMATLLRKTLATYMVAIISGGSFEQFLTQFVTPLAADEAQLEHLLLLPTSGASFYHHTNDGWVLVYTQTLSTDDTNAIMDALKQATDLFHIETETPYGPTIEYRGSQITLSPLGQHAPVVLKKDWDPDQKKRKEIVAFITPLLVDFSITIGGMTSIDITKKGIDKAFGIQQIKEYLKINIEDMLYIGDALYPGGNDTPALRTGIDCHAVLNVAATKAFLHNL